MSSDAPEVTVKRKTNPDVEWVVAGVKYGFDKVPQVPSFGSKAFRMRTHFHIFIVDHSQNQQPC
jgi:hypothetical protein